MGDPAIEPAGEEGTAAPVSPAADSPAPDSPAPDSPAPASPRFAWLRGSVVWWLVVAAAWGYAFFYLFAELPHVPIAVNDSHTYLTHHWHRTIGYPYFLSAAYGLFGNLYVVTIVQVLLGLTAVTLFARAVWKLFRVPVFSAILAWVFISQANLMVFHIGIKSESLYITLTLFSLTFLLDTVRRGGPWREILLSGITALPVLVRPTAIPLFAGLALLFFFRGRLGLGRAVRLFLPWTAIVVGLGVHNSVAYGHPSLFVRSGKTMLANVVHLMPAKSEGPYAELTNWLAERTKHFSAEREKARSLGSFENVKGRHFERVAYSQKPVPEFSDKITQFVKDNPDLVNGGVVRMPSSPYYGRHHPLVAADNLEAALARIAIRHDPMGYAAQVTSNWVAYWFHTHSITPITGELWPWHLKSEWFDRIRENYEINLPAGDAAAEGHHFRRHGFHHVIYEFMEQPLAMTWLTVKAAFGLVECMIASLAAVAIGFVLLGAILARRRLVSPRLVALGAILAFVHGQVLMMSLSHYPLARYMNIIEIVVVTGAFLALRLPFSGWWTRTRRDRRLFNSRPM